MSGRQHDQESDSLDPPSEKARWPGATPDDGQINTDPMSDVLETIRLSGALFFLWEPSWPFGVGVADGSKLSRHIVPGTDQVISYHIVTEGPCWAAIRDCDPIRLETGDILVLPQGDAYKIADTPQFPSAADEQSSIRFFSAMAAGEVPPVVVDGGAGPGRSKLICGFLGCNLRPYNPLLSTLPRMIRVPAPLHQDDPLSHLIDFALTESRQARGGERCLLLRLSEVMFVEVLRRYMRVATEPESGWLGGLRHPLVGRALGLLHQDIARQWSLEQLSQSIGASRSTLAERFTQIVGKPPMQYLTHWRMQVAASMLSEKPVKVYAIAKEVGYESEAAFSRAFKRVVGLSPKAWREQSARRDDFDRGQPGTRSRSPA